MIRCPDAINALPQFFLEQHVLKKSSFPIELKMILFGVSFKNIQIFALTLCKSVVLKSEISKYNNATNVCFP